MLEKRGYPEIIGDTSDTNNGTYNPNTACTIVASAWGKKPDTVRKAYEKLSDKDIQKFNKIFCNVLKLMASDDYKLCTYNEINSHWLIIF